MKTGMLWFDNDVKTDLPDKINKAAVYYQKKYGCWPNLCFVNPSMLKEGDLRSRNIDIQPSVMILLNHLWLGINDNGTAARSPFAR